MFLVAHAPIFLSPPIDFPLDLMEAILRNHPVIKLDPFIFNFNNRIVVPWLAGSGMDDDGFQAIAKAGAFWLFLLLLLLLGAFLSGREQGLAYVVLEVYGLGKLEFWRDFYFLVHLEIVLDAA